MLFPRHLIGTAIHQQIRDGQGFFHAAVDPIWLHTGKKRETNPNEDSEQTTPDDKMPVLSWPMVQASCDLASELLAPVQGSVLSWIPVTMASGYHNFALTVPDNSMLPEFAEGDVIIVDPTQKAVHTGYVVARSREWDMPTFKQFMYMAGKRYLKPLNPRYPLLEVDDELHICGVVIGKYKDYI